MRFFQARTLSAHAAFRHGFFGRTGGVSEGIYASLNAGLGSGDAPEAVAENRARIAAALQAPHGLVTLRQIHSAKVQVLDAVPPADWRPEGDALVCTVPGLAMGALSADCVPILLADAQAGVVAAVHAGWKGARANIMAATIAAMESCGAQRARIHAAIGPCIAQASYEVGEELRAAFVDLRAADAMFFRPGAAGKFWFDVGGVVENRLQAESLATLTRLPIDTYARQQDCFSFRRTTHQGGGDYGRQVSAIALRF